MSITNKLKVCNIQQNVDGNVIYKIRHEIQYIWYNIYNEKYIMGYIAEHNRLYCKEFKFLMEMKPRGRGI